jgi:hypothetical protein
MSDITTQYDAIAMELLDQMEDSLMNFNTKTRAEILADALYQERVNAIKECITLVEMNGKTCTAELLRTLF